MTWLSSGLLFAFVPPHLQAAFLRGTQVCLRSVFQILFMIFMTAGRGASAGTAVARAAAARSMAAAAAFGGPPGNDDNARYDQQDQDIPDIHAASLSQADGQTNQPDQQRHDPCDGALPEYKGYCPFMAQLPFNGSNGCHTGRIQQAEDQHGRG